MSLRIKKGDKVVVLAGKDKGKHGKVLHVFPRTNRALVENINMIKKHVRKSQKNPQGGLIQQEATVHISNIALTDPVSNKPTRLKTTTAADGSKQRVSANNKALIG